MRLSEFWIAVNDEFGSGYGRSLTRDLVLGELGEFTAEQALAQGIPPRKVWVALCRVCDVPQNRWYGVGQQHRAQA